MGENYVGGVDVKVFAGVGGGAKLVVVFARLAEDVDIYFAVVGPQPEAFL